MCSYFFMPFFLPPAKVTDKSKTNQYFFNSFEFTSLWGNITHSVFDHDNSNSNNSISEKGLQPM